MLKLHNSFRVDLGSHLSIEFSSINYEPVVGSFRYLINAIISNY